MGNNVDWWALLHGGILTVFCVSLSLGLTPQDKSRVIAIDGVADEGFGRGMVPGDGPRYGREAEASEAARRSGRGREGTITCRQRKKCVARRDDRPLSFYDQNCYCDEACPLYGDCCKDYDGPRAPGRAEGFRLSKKTLSCTRVIEIDPMAEIYRVDTCPKDYTDAFVREKCENDVAPETFLEIPVSGLNTGLLYRNYYCAICAGDTNITFWNIRWKCDKEPDMADTMDTEEVLEHVWLPGSGGCSIEYTPPYQDVTYRKCKSSLSRCPKSYKNEAVAEKCKSFTSYVYVVNSHQIFQNEFCAQCYAVNDTYLTCDDPRSLDVSPWDPPQSAVVPFSLLLDLNTGKGQKVSAQTNDKGERQETRQVVDLMRCSEGQVYDPFSSECRQIFCLPPYEFVGGLCAPLDGSPEPQDEDSTVRENDNPDFATVVPPDPEEDHGFEIRPIPGLGSNPGGQDSDNEPDMDEKSEPVPSERIDQPDPQNDVPVIPNIHQKQDPDSDPEETYGNNGEVIWDPIDKDSVANANAAQFRDCPLLSFGVGEYTILANNSVHIQPLKVTYDLGDYLIHGAFVYICTPQDKNSTAVQNETYNVEMFKFSRVQNLLSFVGLLMSLVSLFVCIIVYIALPPLRNVPGKCVISLSVALFVGQILFLVGTTKAGNSTFCLTIAALMHYFFLVAFVWTNCLAMDICRTLSSVPAQPLLDGNSRRFVGYSIYGWLGPALVVGGALVLDFLDEIPVDDIYRPHYGDGICWITRRYALIILFAAPLALLMIANIIIYIVSIYNLFHVKVATKAAAQREKDRNRFILYIKLAFVMALTWIFGLLAALLHVGVLWYVFIAFNALQGVFICFAFVCTRKVFRLLRGIGRVHRTTSTSRATYSNGGANHATVNTRWGYTRPATYLYAEDDARIISQETSI